MKEITLYTIHCPHCNVLEQLLKRANINFVTVDDFDRDALAETCGYSSSPILKVGKTYYDYSGAVKWLKEGNK